MGERLPSVSQELERLIKILEPGRNRASVTMDGKDFDRLVTSLSILRKMARAQEAELGTLRLEEAGRQGRAAVEKLATDQAAGLIFDPEGKVLRPDFGRRP